MDGRSGVNAGRLPPLPSWNGGEELVDLANRDALYAVFDETDWLMQSIRRERDRR
ncbi:MAG: hypothetical protein OXI03_07875 [Chloroflexota bacterium]|nr:hypothetical protein [Chloroflexota bacterium]